MLTPFFSDIQRGRKHIKWIRLIAILCFVSPLSHTQEISNMKIPHSDQMIEIKHGAGDPTHAVIWLHGLGASSNDFPPVIPHLKLTEGFTVRFVFPQAPSRPITVNQGMVMPGWYDIKGTSIADKEDLQGITESKLIVDALIQQQIDQGIASENIILIGFSQGAAMSYYAGIRSQHKLAGIAALSGYVLFAEKTADEQSGTNKSTPILSMHGIYDGIVPVKLGQAGMQHLKKLGYDIEWHTYEMEHNVIPEQIEDIGRWMNAVFSDSP